MIFYSLTSLGLELSAEIGLNIFISKFCTETIQKHAINDRIRTKA